MIKLKARTISLRVTDVDYERYSLAAAKAEMYLSAWLKMMVDASLKNKGAK